SLASARRFARAIGGNCVGASTRSSGGRSSARPWPRRRGASGARRRGERWPRKGSQCSGGNDRGRSQPRERAAAERWTSRRHRAPGSGRARRRRTLPAMLTWLRRRWFEVASLGAGLLILAGTLRVTGIDELVQDLSTIGWGLVVVVMIEGLSVV